MKARMITKLCLCRSIQHIFVISKMFKNGIKETGHLPFQTTTQSDQHRTVWFLKTVHSFHDHLATHEVPTKAVWPTGFHLHLASDLSLPYRAESSTPPSRYQRKHTQKLNTVHLQDLYIVQLYCKVQFIFPAMIQTNLFNATASLCSPVSCILPPLVMLATKLMSAIILQQCSTMFSYFSIIVLTTTVMGYPMIEQSTHLTLS